MAEWWQSQAYNDRAAAGLVQTPGLIDLGGIYDAIQAPYWQRQDREQGNAVADPISIYSKSGYVAQPRFASAMSQDPMQQYAESGYVAKPRFVSAPTKPSAPWTSNNFQMAAIRNAEQPAFRVATGPDGNRLTPNASGYGTQDGYSGNSAVAAIDNMAPRTTGPTFPLKMPRATGTPYSGNYTASMRFASPNAGKGSDIIDLTASNPSDRGAQGIADSQGAPVRVGQKVYYPGGKAPVGAPQARNAPAQQQRSGGLGGLLGSIFGGGNLGGGGRTPISITVPGGNTAPAPSYATTEFQQDRFQTTPGAQMPASMSNSRWTTGY